MNEKDFNLFKEWLYTKLIFNQGAIAQMSIENNDTINCSLSIKLTKEDLKEFYELQKESK